MPLTRILMLAMGNSPSFVAECLGIDSATVYRYWFAYLHGGVGELLEKRHKGYWEFFWTVINRPSCAGNGASMSIRTLRV